MEKIDPDPKPISNSPQTSVNTSMAASLDANSIMATDTRSRGDDLMVDAILSTGIENLQFKGNTPSGSQHSNTSSVRQSPVPETVRSFDVTSRLVVSQNSNQVGIVSSRYAMQDASQLIRLQRPRVDQSILNHASRSTSSQAPQVDQSILNHASRSTSSHGPQVDQIILPSNMSSTNVLQDPSQMTTLYRAQVDRSSQSRDHRLFPRAIFVGNTPSGFYYHNQDRSMVDQLDGSLLSSGFGGNAAIGQSYGYRGVMHPQNLRPNTFQSGGWQLSPVHGQNYVHLVPAYNQTRPIPNPSGRFQTASHSNWQAVAPSNNQGYIMVSTFDEALENAFGPSYSGSVAIPGYAISNQSAGSHSGRQVAFGNQRPPSHMNYPMHRRMPMQSSPRQQPYTLTHARGQGNQNMAQINHQKSAIGFQRPPSHIGNPRLATSSPDYPTQMHHRMLSPSPLQQQQTYMPTHFSGQGNQIIAQRSHQRSVIGHQRQTHHSMPMPSSLQQQWQPCMHNEFRFQDYQMIPYLNHQRSAIDLQRPPSHMSYPGLATSSQMDPKQDYYNISMPSPSQQQPDEPLHIKGPDIFNNRTEPVGEKCELCERDLAFDGQKPSSDSSGLLPIVAVLPCGHCYHDSCAKFAFNLKEPYDCPPCIRCQET